MSAPPEQPSPPPGVVKTPATKKSGAPKAKGAVRAKSGCYTCRIRRKKCDERPDAEGRCETCLRLRLQCLGFGAKRPDWLRENNNVTELRDKIKSFLASQGMIKGHSGSGPRAPEQEPPTLHLSTQPYNSPPESPPSQLLVLSDEVVRHGPVSNVREQEWPGPFPGAPPNYEGHPPGVHPMMQPHPVGQSSRNPSPFGPPSQEGFPPQEPYVPTLSHNTSLVPPPQQWLTANMIHHPTYRVALLAPPQQQQLAPPGPPPTAVVRLPPTQASAFGRSYTAVLPDDQTEHMFFASVNDATHRMPSFLFANGALDELANHYVTTVAALQYQLADKGTLPQILFDAVEKEGIARAAARLLASLCKAAFDDDDALAALNIISTFLFDGGHGDWQRWLQVASIYSNSILEDRSRFHDYRDALMNCSDKERFIIKTTFWFDVLASVTTMASPNFVNVIDSLYNPSNQSGVYDVSEDSDSLSMLPVMGCENRIVWALAKTSQLYVWKQAREKEGRLSVVELSRRATDIESFLTPPNPPLASRTDEDVARALASEVFRTSTVVYLRTIVSGDHPLVPEISEAVAEAVASLEKVCEEPESVRHVVATKRSLLLKQLEDEGSVGNCVGIYRLLQELNLGQAKPKAVPWRRLLHEQKMLLV
ncbi:hypothetical protein BT96DRAFT_975672 [Gymnopus androsaceus JB14]|uniref:Zn(2)-C6 fungal-type domain-containing protein n=1 Tax=Gymnopus androsaceus JB14 TaxID=1447944 RepID=A0A6A4HLJ9_9AGAR|nr:hypothetical protein BT96DRAFT_975672 [Gymnopus androsaceus JB14]